MIDIWDEIKIKDRAYDPALAIIQDYAKQVSNSSLNWNCKINSLVVFMKRHILHISSFHFRESIFIFDYFHRLNSNKLKNNNNNMFIIIKSMIISNSYSVCSISTMVMNIKYAYRISHIPHIMSIIEARMHWTR